MTSMSKLLWSAALGLGLAAWLGVVESRAQTPKEDDKESSIREQDIYIPYEKLRQVFEKHGRGVFLPYEKFQELWEAAREKTQPADRQKPPVGALITEVANEATVEKDVVRVRAAVKIEMLAEGWHEVPLRLGSAAITSATIDGQPAKILGSSDDGYRLLVQKKGKQPESLELKLDYARAIARTPGQNSVAFDAPLAPVSRWRIVIPQTGVKVNLSPMIAATEAPAEAEANKTVVLAFVGAAPTVRIDWTPKAEGATGMATIADVLTAEQLWLGEGVVRTRATLQYTISRAELGRLVIDVPKDQKIVNVLDANVRQWSVEQAKDHQRVAVELFEPAKKTQQVIVELEKIVGHQAKETLTAPVIEAVGVGRQQGTVVVHVADSLRAEAVKSGNLLQVDAEELRGGSRQNERTFAYRYASVPFELAFEIEKVQPRISVDSLVVAQVRPDRLVLDLTAVYTIEKAGIFRMEWDIPTGYRVESVRGVETGSATGVAVEAHYLEGERKTRLVVNLSHKAIGPVALAVRLEKELQQPELLAPCGKPYRFELAMPRPAPRAVERSIGALVVCAPESLRVNPDKTTGLRAITVQEAFETIDQPAFQSQDQLRPALAYGYAEGPATVALAAERRKPRVTIKQLAVARVEEGVVKYDFTFFYDVLYSGVKSLRIDVPADVATSLRVATQGIREKVIEPPPADLAKGDVAWSLAGDSEFLGTGKIALSYEKKIDKLEVGKRVEFKIPQLRPRGVDLAWGQIVLVKSETIDVHELGEPKALRPIDPQYDLMAPVASAARAFEFHDDWRLVVEATRYEMEKVKHTSIERALVRMVVTPADVVSTQALYRMRSARQRLTVKLPEGATFDAQPLRIDGRPATLEKGGKDEYYVPLADVKAERPFVLELRYRMAGDGRRLDLPAFPEEGDDAGQCPAVIKTFVAVYLPETRALLGVRGPWTEEFRWRIGPTWQWRPYSDLLPYQRVQWISEGVEVAGKSSDDFQLDGTLYEYSTLRPATGPEGSIRLASVDGWSLKGLIFAATVLLGLLLLPARLGVRTFVVGMAVIALVLIGSLAPTFARQVLGGSLISAVFIVGVIWTVAAAVRYRRPTAPPQDKQVAFDFLEGGRTDA